MIHRPLRFLGLAGSLRRASWNRRLLRSAATLVPPGVAMEIYDDLSTVPMFDEDLEQATAPDGPPGVRALRAALARADGLVIATPEYNHALPGVLKNALDWLSRDEPALAELPVAVLGASSGPWGTRLAQAALRQVLHTCGALVMPAPTLFVAHADTRFSAGDELTDQALRASLACFMGSFALWVDRVRPQPTDASADAKAAFRCRA